MMDEFFCRYCLEVTVAADYPTECQHCHVGYCGECGTRLKAAESFCYGCGAIRPVVKATMYRTSSTGGAYAMISWQREGLGFGRTSILTIARGWDNVDDMQSGTVPPHTRIVVFEHVGVLNEKRPSEIVRDLTVEEADALGYPRWEPAEAEQ